MEKTTVFAQNWRRGEIDVMQQCPNRDAACTSTQRARSGKPPAADAFQGFHCFSIPPCACSKGSLESTLLRDIHPFPVVCCLHFATWCPLVHSDRQARPHCCVLCATKTGRSCFIRALNGKLTTFRRHHSFRQHWLAGQGQQHDRTPGE